MSKANYTLIDGVPKKIVTVIGSKPMTASLDVGVTDYDATDDSSESKIEIYTIPAKSIYSSLDKAIIASSSIALAQYVHSRTDRSTYMTIVEWVRLNIMSQSFRPRPPTGNPNIAYNLIVEAVVNDRLITPIGKLMPAIKYLLPASGKYPITREFFTRFFGTAEAKRMWCSLYPNLKPHYEIFVGAILYMEFAFASANGSVCFSAVARALSVQIPHPGILDEASHQIHHILGETSSEVAVNVVASVIRSIDSEMPNSNTDDESDSESIQTSSINDNPAKPNEQDPEMNATKQTAPNEQTGIDALLHVKKLDTEVLYIRDNALHKGIIERIEVSVDYSGTYVRYAIVGLEDHLMISGVVFGLSEGQKAIDRLTAIRNF